MQKSLMFPYPWLGTIKGATIAPEFLHRHVMHATSIAPHLLPGHTPPAEALHRVLYRMAERATAGLPLYEFLREVHVLLGDLLYARNFYVCLVNAERSTLDFPYYVDEKDGDTMQCDDVPMRRGLTEFVLRTQCPQLIDAPRFAQLEAQGEVTEATGDLTFTAWLGVPMQMRGVVGGVLVVQSYEAGVGYSPGDADLLSFVANQFGSVLERHQAMEALRQSEARYRSVFEHLGVGVVVVQGGRMVFVNPAMVRMVGRSEEYLMSQAFTACVHPDDVPLVMERHERRLRGEGVEPFYGVRVLTQEHHVRHLEVSGASLDWNDRPATLLFAVDATARIEAEAAQHDAVERQRELNELKARFIAMASHEFRTPLSAISGSVDLLTHYAQHLPPEEQQDALQKIRNAVGRMTHMLENVLVTGQAESGLLPFNPLPVAVTPWCRALVDEIRAMPNLRSSTAAVVVELPPPTARYLLDEGLLRHVVGNLLSNAIKYSPSGGEVRVKVWAEGQQLIVRVEDHGIGISGQDLPRLFDRFHRGGNVGHISGTGLGLFIVRQAAASHLGTVEVTSTLGQGSCFTVSLQAPSVH